MKRLKLTRTEDVKLADWTLPVAAIRTEDEDAACFVPYPDQPKSKRLIKALLALPDAIECLKATLAQGLADGDRETVRWSVVCSIWDVLQTVEPDLTSKFGVPEQFFKARDRLAKKWPQE